MIASKTHEIRAKRVYPDLPRSSTVVAECSCGWTFNDELIPFPNDRKALDEAFVLHRIQALEALAGLDVRVTQYAL